jgi:hypothetical protein
MAMRISINWNAAIYAGIAAGIVAPMVQIILWWAFWHALPGILFRDARLGAAIVMGSRVLSPHANLDWQVMFAASVIHFALSIIYSVILAAFIAGYDLLFAIFVGVLYGLVLFVVNMYGFTIIFPWFAEARDWITFVAHPVFGAVAAGLYKMLSMR